MNHATENRSPSVAGSGGRRLGRPGTGRGRVDSDLRWYVRKLLGEGWRALPLKPAGRALALEHCRYVDPGRPQTIVEVGAGTGAVTRAVLGRLHPASRVIAVEVDADLAACLRRSCARAEVLACDARDLRAHLDRLEVRRIDVMISCLGPKLVPRAVHESVLGCLARWGRDAWFAQQTLIPSLYRRMYERLFGEVDFRLVMANLPPGGVYHCRGLRPEFRQHLPAMW